MKTRTNIISSLLLLLLCISMFSACQGENTTGDLNNTETREQTGSDNQIDPGETAAEQKTYSDPQDITTMLQELERIRMEQWLAQPGWWHAQKVFKDQSGNLHGTGGEEWWFQFSDAQTCPQTLQTIFQEDGQVSETSLLISESDLPEEAQNAESAAEEPAVQLVIVPDQSCPPLLDLTLEHAAQLLNDPGLQSAQAVIQDGYLTITVDQKSDIYRQVLTVTIDLITGFLTNEKTQLYVADNQMPEGEIEFSYSYQYYEQLPPEIQSQFDQALGGLE